MDANKVQRSIVLYKEQLEKLNEISKKKFLSVNDIIRQAIIDYIKKVENDSKQ